ncbi:MAG: hypothetical protein FJ298_02260 [Planctomycetes bacterium]|nr:hypothetical protein [Planctomycetota bacterium]
MLPLLVLVAQLAPPAPSVQPAVPAERSAPIVAYAGTLRAGRLELAQLSKRGEHDAARELCAALLAQPDFDAQSELERAEALYAIGLARGRAREIPEAVEHLHRATGLAGSNELGRAAAYNAATFLLQGAESLRAQVPEIREQLGLPPLEPDPATQAQSASGAQAPDPLDVAREAYLFARRELATALRCERLADDVRANLELCVRRLRELDSIERKREEQQQQQDQRQRDEQDQQDREQGEQRQQDPSQQQPEDDEEKGQAPQQQDPSEQQEPQPEQPQPQQQDSQDESSKDAEPQSEQAQRPLSPEEMQRLLQQLQQIDEKAKEVEALLRERRRQPVKRDW